MDYTVWTREGVAVEMIADQYQNPNQLVTVITEKARRTVVAKGPEHDIDPATVEVTREPLINNPALISVADARHATGVLLPRGMMDRWRLTAMTRPVINGVTHDIAPDVRDLRVPTYHTPGVGDYAAFTNIRPEES